MRPLAHSLAAADPEDGFSPGTPKPSAVPPLSVLSPPTSIMNRHAERPERRLIEVSRSIEVRDGEAHMIDHACAPSACGTSDNGRMTFDIHIIGGGLAGSEAAWQLAEAGLRVRLSEMRGGGDTTPAHETDRLAEMVCSNSFRSDDAEHNAVGLLHQEMRALGSLIMRAADEHRVPGGLRARRGPRGVRGGSDRGDRGPSQHHDRARADRCSCPIIRRSSPPAR